MRGGRRKVNRQDAFNLFPISLAWEFRLEKVLPIPTCSYKHRALIDLRIVLQSLYSDRLIRLSPTICPRHCHGPVHSALILIYRSQVGDVGIDVQR